MVQDVEGLQLGEAHGQAPISSVYGRTKISYSRPDGVLGERRTEKHLQSSWLPAEVAPLGWQSRWFLSSPFLVGVMDRWQLYLLHLPVQGTDTWIQRHAGRNPGVLLCLEQDG